MNGSVVISQIQLMIVYNQCAIALWQVIKVVVPIFLIYFINFSFQMVIYTIVQQGYELLVRNNIFLVHADGLLIYHYVLSEIYVQDRKYIDIRQFISLKCQELQLGKVYRIAKLRANLGLLFHDYLCLYFIKKIRLFCLIKIWALNLKKLVATFYRVLLVVPRVLSKVVSVSYLINYQYTRNYIYYTFCRYLILSFQFLLLKTLLYQTPHYFYRKQPFNTKIALENGFGKQI